MAKRGQNSKNKISALIFIYINILMFILATSAFAQFQIEKLPNELKSGVHNGDASLGVRSVFRYTLSQDDARWLRLYFNEWNLGKESYLTITSQKDNERQYFNAKSLKDWKSSSAYFNGNAVEIELFAAPGDRNVYFNLKEVSAAMPALPASAPVQGKWNKDENESEFQEICDGTDDRQLTNPYDYAVGRPFHDEFEGLNDVFCTAWISSNGALLTAGHCVKTQEQKERLEGAVIETKNLG